METITDALPLGTAYGRAAVTAGSGSSLNAWPRTLGVRPLPTWRDLARRSYYRLHAVARVVDHIHPSVALRAVRGVSPLGRDKLARAGGDVTMARRRGAPSC
jgi:hypothetical protein